MFDSIRGLVHILLQFVTLLFADLCYGRLSIAWIDNLPSRIFVEGRGRRGRVHDGGWVPDGVQPGWADVRLRSFHPFPCLTGLLKEACFCQIAAQVLHQ